MNYAFLLAFLISSFGFSIGGVITVESIKQTPQGDFSIELLHEAFAGKPSRAIVTDDDGVATLKIVDIIAKELALKSVEASTQIPNSGALKILLLDAMDRTRDAYSAAKLAAMKELNFKLAVKIEKQRDALEVLRTKIKGAKTPYLDATDLASLRLWLSDQIADHEYSVRIDGDIKLRQHLLRSETDPGIWGGAIGLIHSQSKSRYGVQFDIKSLGAEYLRSKPVDSGTTPQSSAAATHR